MNLKRKNADPHGACARIGHWMAPLLLGVLCGCGMGGDQGANGLPAPGHMELISVTPISEVAGASLIPHDAFETWWAGAPAPASEVVLIPQSGSTIERDSNGAADGLIAIRQTWTEKDSRWAPQRLFGVRLENLTPMQEYTFSAAFRAADGISATIEVYADSEPGAPLNHVALNWVEVMGDGNWQRVQARFSPGEFDSVRIVTAHYDAIPAESTVEVSWDEWRLSEQGPASWPEPEADGENLILNGSFETWVPGEPAPRGPFTAPGARFGHSSVVPWMIAPVGTTCAQQRWTESDQEDPVEGLFGVEAEVASGTDYEFRCVAHTGGKYRCVVEVHAKDGASWKLLGSAELGADKAWQHGVVTFNSGDSSSVRIVTRSLESDAGYPSEVAFDAWKLQAVAE